MLGVTQLVERQLAVGVDPEFELRNGHLRPPRFSFLEHGCGLVRPESCVLVWIDPCLVSRFWGWYAKRVPRVANA